MPGGAWGGKCASSSRLALCPLGLARSDCPSADRADIIRRCRIYANVFLLAFCALLISYARIDARRFWCHGDTPRRPCSQSSTVRGETYRRNANSSTVSGRISRILRTSSATVSACRAERLRELLQDLHTGRMFAISSPPPRQIGMMWSFVAWAIGIRHRGHTPFAAATRAAHSARVCRPNSRADARRALRFR